MRAEKRFLSASVSPQPLIHRYYAWPQMISPVTLGLNLRGRHLPILDSYLANPHIHAKALTDPARWAGPFLDPGAATLEELREFRDRLARHAAPVLSFAEDVAAARALVAERAGGGPLTPLYLELPPSLRGLVELGYDDLDRASLRFFEALVYRCALYDRSSQVLSLLTRPDPDQPFIFHSPLLPGPHRVDVSVPFDSELIDHISAARWEPTLVRELAEALGVADGDLARFTALFTDQAPVPPEPAPERGVRMRFLGHAGVLLESPSAAVLLDPIVGYADGSDHLHVTDLPRRLDAIVLSHAHCDHMSLETLIQLRHKVDQVVVPGGSGGSVLDPGLAPMLRALGFDTVVELAELERRELGDGLAVTSVPFLGEHADLDIRAKMVPLVEISSRRMLFATDTVVIEPRLFERLGELLTGIDALFIGLECVGAPMSWLYGPLLGHRPRREHDRTRRLSGSDAKMADQLAVLTGAERVYSYAMGFEPWLRHMTGSQFDAASEQATQAALLDELCAARGVPSQLLYLRGEWTW